MDVYKNQWMRKRRLEQVSDNSTPDDCNLSTNEHVMLEPEPAIQMSTKSTVGDRQILKHEMLGNRTSIESVDKSKLILNFVSIPHFCFVARDPNSLVETISFANIGKLQPFLISLNTTALVVMDVHCSLTRSEVVGYLAGQWDINTNSEF